VIQEIMSDRSGLLTIIKLLYCVSHKRIAVGYIWKNWGNLRHKSRQTSNFPCSNPYYLCLNASKLCI